MHTLLLQRGISRSVCLFSLVRSARGLSAESSSNFIGNHRVVVVPAVEKGPTPFPPIVLLGGTAQTAQSWTGHLPGLSRWRDVVYLELRGQGRPNPRLPVTDVDLPAQVMLSRIRKHWSLTIAS